MAEAHNKTISRWPAGVECDQMEIVSKPAAADGLPPPPAPAPIPGALEGQPALDAWVVELVAETIAWRARHAASEPEKNFLKLKHAAQKACMNPGTVWAWHNSGQLDSYKIEGCRDIMVEFNDLIARKLRTGRHSGRRGRRKQKDFSGFCRRYQQRTTPLAYQLKR